MRRPSLPSLPARPSFGARRPLLVAVAVLVVVAGGFFAVRDSSFFAVEDVSVVGMSGPDAPKVEAALRDAARDMTTLHVRGDELDAVVESYPTVTRIDVDRDLPHTLKLRVIEKITVATVEAGGRRVPVTADGRLLAGATPRDDLPQLMVKGNPGNRIEDGRGRDLLRVAAAAPTPLRHRARRAFFGEEGLTLAMRDGPSVYFGSTENLAAKWAAAARVLADPTAEGARYIDVRVPERVAAGGLAPPAEEEPTEDPPAPTTTTPADPAAAAQPDPATTTPAPAATTPAPPVTPPAPDPQAQPQP